MLFTEMNMVGKDGKMLPAIRNLITLVFCAVSFSAGWFGHMNWSHRAEVGQLVKDAAIDIKIREDEEIRTNILEENIDYAIQIEQTDCDCGDATDIDFMRQLRSGREERSKFNFTNPF